MRMLSTLVLTMGLLASQLVFGMTESEGAKIAGAKSITVYSKNMSIYKGEARKIDFNLDATKYKGLKYKYITSNRKVVKIDKKGNIIGLSNGKALVTAKALNNKNKTVKSLKINVSVKSLTYKSVRIILNNNVLFAGDKLQAGVRLSPDIKFDNSYTFSGNNPNVASVGSLGEVYGLAPGTVKLNVKTLNGIRDQVELKVVKKPVLKVRGVEIALNESIDDAVLKLGAPQRIENSYFGEKTYVYNGDYSKLLFLYVEKNKVAGFYTDSMDFSIDDAKYGSDYSLINQRMIKSNLFKGRYISENNLYKTELYVDEIGTKKVVGVRVLSSDIKMKPMGDVVTDMENQIYDLTNSIRVRNDLSILYRSESVDVVSRNHSIDMMKKGYFSHVNLSGEEPWDRAQREGLSFSFYGENIIGGYGDSVDSSFGWFQSKDHRENILIPDYIHLGVGGAVGGKLRNYFTQNFVSF